MSHSLIVSNLILHLSTAILQAILTSGALTSLDSIRSNSARRDELMSVKMIDKIVRIALVSRYSKVARPVILQPMHSLLNEIMTVHHGIIDCLARCVEAVVLNCSKVSR